MMSLDCRTGTDQIERAQVTTEHISWPHFTQECLPGHVALLALPFFFEQLRAVPNRHQLKHDLLYRFDHEGSVTIKTKVDTSRVSDARS